MVKGCNYARKKKWKIDKTIWKLEESSEKYIAMQLRQLGIARKCKQKWKGLNQKRKNKLMSLEIKF